MGQLSIQHQTAALVAKGKEAVMPDFAKPGGQDMQKETACSKKLDSAQWEL